MGLFSGCLKHGTDRTINPSMTATIGTLTFSAKDVQPETLKPQLNDSATTLIITGDDAPNELQIKLTITKYKGVPGTYSIAADEANGYYTHAGIVSPASSGIVVIKDIGANTVSGYFNFTTTDGISISNGNYVVGKPWSY